MKRLLLVFASLTFLGIATPAARADVELSVDFFYDQLGEFGTWRDVGDYGYCWHPNDVDDDWRPYRDGRWLYTDAGWTWDSEEPYGWAVYHYGRWARVRGVGWVWVPDTEWGPAWVSWRRSPDYVGWAPLPPEARFRRHDGFHAWVDSYFDIGPVSFNFVTARNFGAPRLREVVVEPRQNLTIINRTTNITNITYVNNVVVNQGPDFDRASQESATPFRRLRLDRREQFDADPRTLRAEQFKTRVEGDSLRIAAPQVRSVAVAAPKRVAPKVASADVDRGWKPVGAPQAEVERARAKMKAEAKQPADLPARPKFEKVVQAPTAAPAAPEKPTVPAPEKPTATVPGKPTPPTPDKPQPPTVPTPPDPAKPAPVTPEKPPTAEPEKPNPEKPLRPSPRRPVPREPGKTVPPATEKPSPAEPGKPERPLRPRPERTIPPTPENPQNVIPEKPSKPERPTVPDRPENPRRPLPGADRPQPSEIPNSDVNKPKPERPRPSTPAEPPVRKARETDNPEPPTNVPPRGPAPERKPKTEKPAGTTAPPASPQTPNPKDKDSDKEKKEKDKKKDS
jgi:hypothetical protein